MAAPLGVSWEQIRRDWESTLKSDADLATQYGFGSKTSIARKRKEDGWRRDDRKINAEVVARAEAPGRPAATTPDVSAGHTPDTRRTHGQNERSQAVEEEPGLCVSDGQSTNTSLSRRENTFAAARIVDPVEDWLEIKADAKRRHLRMARELQDANIKVVRAISGVMDGPGMSDLGGEADTPYGLAIISTRAINADRETMAGLLKAATDGLDKSIKLERTLLGMDDAEQPGGANSDNLPAGVVSEEVFLSHYAGNMEALENLANFARDIHRQGGRIVDAEVLPQPEAT